MQNFWWNKADRNNNSEIGKNVKENDMLPSGQIRNSQAYRREGSMFFYYMENLKVAEIAEQLHESVSSIKSKLMRARKYLKKELEDFVL